MLSEYCCCLFGRREEPIREPLLVSSYHDVEFFIPPTYRPPVMGNLFQQIIHHQHINPNIFGDWKLHISIDPSNIDDVARAWTKIIIPKMTEFGIREFKIARENQLSGLREGGESQGKLITIYLKENRDLMNQEGREKLNALLNEIESELAKENINPGAKPVIDYQIQGSRYISCRCDAWIREDTMESGVILPLVDSEALRRGNERNTPPYNPYSLPDSFGLLNMVISHSLSLAI